MVSIVFLCEQLVFCAFIQKFIEHYLVFKIERMWTGRYQPTLITQVLTNKNYTDHVPTNDELVPERSPTFKMGKEVDAPDFGN